MIADSVVGWHTHPLMQNSFSNMDGVYESVIVHELGINTVKFLIVPTGVEKLNNYELINK